MLSQQQLQKVQPRQQKPAQDDFQNLQVTQKAEDILVQA